MFFRRKVAILFINQLSGFLVGGSGGVGKEVALQLVQRGAKVILACRDEDRGKAAAAEIKAKTNSDTVYTLSVDLADFSSVRDFVKKFFSKEERVDFLINNAGKRNVQCMNEVLNAHQHTKANSCNKVFSPKGSSLSKINDKKA